MTDFTTPPGDVAPKVPASDKVAAPKTPVRKRTRRRKVTRGAATARRRSTTTASGTGAMTTNKVSKTLNVGDAGKWNEKNAAMQSRVLNPGKTEVLSGDIVYSTDPGKQFRFYLFDFNALDASRRYLKQRELREKGYMRCTTDLFTSQSERYSEDGGVVNDGPGREWYAQPREIMEQLKRQREMAGAESIRYKHVSENLRAAQDVPFEGFTASADIGETIRGERIK